jgi:protein TonB
MLHHYIKGKDVAMSYLNQTHDPRRRVAGVAVTAGVHAVLAVGVITGLAIVGVKGPEFPPMKPIDFTSTPETPPKPIPTETQETNSTIVTPKPEFDLPTTSTAEAEIFDDTKPFVGGVSTTAGDGLAVTTPPPPPPAFLPQRAAPANGPAGWITTDDYPARALRSEAEGLTRYRVIVGSNGKVSSCEVTAGSGDALLDSTTCKLITRRARFDPATDGTGASVVGSYSGSVHWEIPD